MTPSGRGLSGFTLFEVLAAVLVLGLIFSMLADAAIVALRSEGIDRRRAEASLLADRELAALESLLASGAPLENGVTTRDEEPYRIDLEVQPEDVPALVAASLPEQEGIRGTEDEDLATLLFDERGDSRIQRVRVRVEWDEAGETESVERITHHFDTSELAALFPGEDEAGAAALGGDDDDDLPAFQRDLEGQAPKLLNLMGGSQ